MVEEQQDQLKCLITTAEVLLAFALDEMRWKFPHIHTHPPLFNGVGQAPLSNCLCKGLGPKQSKGESGKGAAASECGPILSQYSFNSVLLQTQSMESVIGPTGCCLRFSSLHRVLGNE